MDYQWGGHGKGVLRSERVRSSVSLPLKGLAPFLREAMWSGEVVAFLVNNMGIGRLHILWPETQLHPLLAA